MATIFGQEIQSTVEFYDTTANKKTGEIGWTGNAENGSFFIGANGQKRLVIKNDTTTVTGHMKATSYVGDGSKLTGITADSVRAASVADSSKKIPDGSVTNAKLAASIKIKDENIDSVSWNKLKNIPAGILKDSVTYAKTADSAKALFSTTTLNASKINSGIFDTARLPINLRTLSTTGKLASNQLPSVIDGTKISKLPVDSIDGKIPGSKVNPNFDSADIYTNSCYLKNYASTNPDVRLSVENGSDKWVYFSRYYGSKYGAIFGTYIGGPEVWAYHF